MQFCFVVPRLCHLLLSSVSTWHTCFLSMSQPEITVLLTCEAIHAVSDSAALPQSSFFRDDDYYGYFSWLWAGCWFPHYITYISDTCLLNICMTVCFELFEHCIWHHHNTCKWNPSHKTHHHRRSLRTSRLLYIGSLRQWKALGGTPGFSPWFPHLKTHNLCVLHTLIWFGYFPIWVSSSLSCVICV